MAEADVLEVDAPEVEVAPEAPSLVTGSVEAGLSPELQAQLAAIKEPEPEAPAEQDTPAEPEAPVDRMPQWVNDALQNSKSITQVPRSQQAAVIDAMRAEWIAQSNQYGQQQFTAGMEFARQQAQAEARRAELEAMQEDDPAGFVAWSKENPVEAAKFLQGQMVSTPDPTAGLQAEAAAELAKLEAYPEAKAEIFAHPDKYPPTPAGLRALVRDVAMAEARAQITPPSVQANSKAEQRQQAVERVKAAPKVDVAGGGSTVGGTLTTDKLKSLAGMDFHQAMRELDGYSREEQDRALRGMRAG